MEGNDGWCKWVSNRGLFRCWLFKKPVIIVITWIVYAFMQSNVYNTIYNMMYKQCVNI